MSLQIPSASNFRDLAAHVPAHHGLRRHTLFRSDHLGALNADDARQILSLGVKRVLDFRGQDERTAAACVLPDVKVHSLAIEPTVVQALHALMAERDLTESDVVRLMQDTYRGFVRESSPRFAEFFGHLLESNEPTVFHCTAGKDRTGFAAALVLRALGVPQADVMRDYLLTNERLKPITGWQLPMHIVQVLWGVQPAFLDAAFEAVDEDYGGVDSYLRDALRLGAPELRRLRELYLEPGASAR